MTWEDQLWTEMNEKTPAERVYTAGEVITHITRVLLPALGNYRRMTAVHLVEGGDYTATTLAETIGARPGTIQRLIEEGRALRRRGEAA